MARIFKSSTNKTSNKLDFVKYFSYFPFIIDKLSFKKRDADL